MALPITITYNGFVIGTSSSTIRDGSYRETHAYGKYSLTVDFIVTGADDATFVANLQAAEDALKLENKKLTVLFGTETHITLDPTNQAYTGINIRTSLSKGGGQADTNRSRQYSFSVDVELPPSASGKAYQKGFGYSISWDTSNRMSISISGTYTAGGGTPGNADTAGKNYEDDIETWVATVFTNLNAVFTAITIANTDFELVSEKVDFRDELNHVVGYSRSYKQRLFPDQFIPSDHASIKNAQVSFTRSYTNKRGNKGDGPWRVAVSYSCNVDNRQTTYSGLKDLYKKVIKPWITSQARESFGGKLSVIEGGSEKFDVTGNGISANLTVLIYGGTNGRLKEDVAISIKYDPRNNYIDRWDGEDYSYSTFSPGMDITSTMSIDIDQIGDGSKIKNPGSVPPNPVYGGGFWDETSYSVNSSSTEVGNDPDSTGELIKISSKRFSMSFKWVKHKRPVIKFPFTRPKTILKRVAGNQQAPTTPPKKKRKPNGGYSLVDWGIN